MSAKLFVGGLPYETTQGELLKLFSACGQVFGVKLIMDRETGRSKGFAFVEMADEAGAKAALAKLNGSALGARKIFVNEARPQEKPAFGGKPAFAPKAAFVPPPGFVERRSGRDRRLNPGFGSPAGSAGPERREVPFARKEWAPKPGGFGAKPGFRGDRPKWGAKSGAGEKKPWAGKKPWGEKKPWADKPEGEKKPWSAKTGFGPKKPWAGKPGGKPGFGGKKPWAKPEGKPGGFTRRAKRGSN